MSNSDVRRDPSAGGVKVMTPPRFLRLGEGDQWLLDKLREAQADPDQKKRDYLNAWTSQN